MDKKSYSTIITFLVLIFIGVAYLIFSDLPAVSGDDLGAQAYSSIEGGVKTPKILQRGTASEEVKELQEFLKKEGFYKGSADGKFGPTTEEAVKSFQNKYGIKPNGIVGGGGSQEVSCDMDVNNDGVINTADLSGLMSEFGSQGTNLNYDLNNDGVVNTSDLTLLLMNFGQDSDCISLQISLSPDTPQVCYADNSPGSNLELLRFNLTAQGTDIVVYELPVVIDIDPASGLDYVSISDVVDSFIISTNGEEVVSILEDTSIFDDDSEYVVFSLNNPMIIDEGDSVEFVVEANLNSFDDTLFVAGTQISASVTASGDYFDAENDLTSGDLTSDQIIGSAIGDSTSIFNEGIFVNFLNSNVSAIVNEGSNNDTGIFVISFEIEAFDEGMLIPKGAFLETDLIATTISGEDSLTYTMDTPNGVLYGTGEDMNGLVQDIATTAEEIGDFYFVDEGSTETFTLTIAKTQDENSFSGLYRLKLFDIPWIGDDWYDVDGVTSSWDVEFYYSYNCLSDYVTDYLYLN